MKVKETITLIYYAPKSTSWSLTGLTAEGLINKPFLAEGTQSFRVTGEHWTRDRILLPPLDERRRQRAISTTPYCLNPSGPQTEIL